MTIGSTPITKTLVITDGTKNLEVNIIVKQAPQFIVVEYINLTVYLYCKMCLHCKPPLLIIVPFGKTFIVIRAPAVTLSF